MSAGHQEASAHPAGPALDPNEAFAWTTERGIPAELARRPWTLLRHFSATLRQTSCPSPRSHGGTARYRRSHTTRYCRVSGHGVAAYPGAAGAWTSSSDSSTAKQRFTTPESSTSSQHSSQKWRKANRDTFLDTQVDRKLYQAWPVRTGGRHQCGQQPMNLHEL